MRTKSYQIIVVLALIAVVWLPSVGGRASAQGPAWDTFTDPRYDFSVEYPRDWIVIPRSDSPDTYGGAVILKPPSAEAGEAEVYPHMEVGLHTIEYNGEPLPLWVSYFEELSRVGLPSEVEVHSRTTVDHPQARGKQAYIVIGRDLSGPFAYAHIPYGSGVWYIWSTGDIGPDTFMRAVNSFRFSSKTPLTPQDAYGPEFIPFRVPPDFAPTDTRFESAAAPLEMVVPLPGTWYAPTVYGNTYTVKCGSGYHTGGAAYATDISMNSGTKVYSSNLTGSYVNYAGDTGGNYGWLIKIDTTISGLTYRAFYAHLEALSLKVSNGQFVGSRQWIANSGNTGTTYAHLHFHIQRGSEPVDLRNLTTFDENTNYPGTYAVCGYMHYP